jgi:hypothetical protein
MRYEKGFISSNFSHFVLGNDKVVAKSKRQSPAFQPARTRDAKPNCSGLQGRRNCKAPSYEPKKHSTVRIEYLNEDKSA